MNQSEPGISTGRLFAINLAGIIGLVWGLGAIACYVLGWPDAFPTRPYRWLELTGAAEFLPPAIVLVVCIGLALYLERSAKP